MKSEITKTWIKKCLTEKQSEISQSHLTQEELREITQEVLLDLRAIFEHFIQAFNDLKSSFLQDAEEHQVMDQDEGLHVSLLRSIHIYNVADTENGFMLFRKGHRLIFTPDKPGCIRIQLIKKENEITTKNLDTYIRAFSDNVMSIKWVHQDQKGFVNLNTLSRYYMKCFLVESDKSTN